jgi:hypothetical protein
LKARTILSPSFKDLLVDILHINGIKEN